MKPHCIVLTLHVLQVSSAAEAVPTVTHVRTLMYMNLPAPHLYIQLDRWMSGVLCCPPAPRGGGRLCAELSGQDGNDTHG